MFSKGNIIFYCKVCFVGLIFSAIYWIGGSSMHYLFFHNTFEFIPSELTELWIRCVTASLLIIFTIILSFFIKKEITLSEKMRLFKRALHAIQEGCMITNRHNEIIYVNPRFEKISGYSFDEVAGKNPKILHSG